MSKRSATPLENFGTFSICLLMWGIMLISLSLSLDYNERILVPIGIVLIIPFLVFVVLIIKISRKEAAEKAQQKIEKERKKAEEKVRQKMIQKDSWVKKAEELAIVRAASENLPTPRNAKDTTTKIETEEEKLARQKEERRLVRIAKKQAEEEAKAEEEYFNSLINLINENKEEILKESEQFYLPVKHFIEKIIEQKKIDDAEEYEDDYEDDYDDDYEIIKKFREKAISKTSEPFDIFLFTFVDFFFEKKLLLFKTFIDDNSQKISNRLFLYFFEKDLPSNPTYPPERYPLFGEDLFPFFIKGVLTRLKLLKKDWITSETINTIAYLILRINFLRFDAEQYELFFPTSQQKAFNAFYLENDLFSKKFNEYFDYYDLTYGNFSSEIRYFGENYFSIKKAYASYRLYNLDVFLPFSVVYNEITKSYIEYATARSAKEIEEEERALENFLFGDSVSSPKAATEESPKPPIELIDELTGRQFEEYISKLFQKMGYSTTLTPTSGDYGIDVIAKNDFLTIGIQTKCYKEKVPNSAVQEAVTGLKHYKLDKAMVITNSDFQPSAYELAKDNNVILWNRKKLIEEIEKYEEKPTLAQKANSSTAKSAAAKSPNDAREKVQIRIGMTVRHAEFGLGTISNLNKNEGYLNVMFGSGTKQFTYPYAFTSNTLKIEE